MRDVNKIGWWEGEGRREEGGGRRKGIKIEWWEEVNQEEFK